MKQPTKASGFEPTTYNNHKLSTFVKKWRYHVFKNLKDWTKEHSHSFREELIDVIDINDLIDQGIL